MIMVKELEDRYGIWHFVMCMALTRMSQVDEATMRKPLHNAIGEMIKENEGRIETLKGLIREAEQQIEMLRKVQATMEEEGI